MTSTTDNPTTAQRLSGQRVALVGKFGGMSRRDVQKLVREHGGVAVERADAADLVVVGEKELPLDEAAGGEGFLDDAIRQAAESGKLSIIGETELWRRLGLVEESYGVRRLYTPAMLADLLGVPVAVVRRWHRRGLIVPAREVRRLAYFDFQEVATARSLAQLLSTGITPAALEKKLSALARFLPGARRRLAQLSVIVEGQQILLRQGDGLIDPGGQLRFDFEASGQLGNRTWEEEKLTTQTQRHGEDSGAGNDANSEMGIRNSESVAQADDSVVGPSAIVHPPSTIQHLPPPDDLVGAAVELEDEGRLSEAAAAYRAALAAGGPSAELNFRLAELLYRAGDVGAARERYYMAIELDEDLVEARANLGCVLSETGERELAVAAFEGALAYHPEYADAQYHLARTLDDLDQPVEARAHWQVFVKLSPESPWADEARARLADEAR